ncbi:MAG: tetratricopeptide repeat protein, partial [Geodermatophilaceae bacterium]|nr:tetratricopeptide repeat protein [Geodermatophilaceae bacterium]
AAAADWARKALEINPAGATSFGVLADALTQLGDYDGATQAIQQMLDLKPGLPAFTRASYNLELHGNIDGARAALEQALSEAYQPPDVAFCRTYLGLLSFSQGDLDGASEQYELGLVEAPGDPNLLLGQARVAAARGEDQAARSGYQRVVDIRPLPEYLVEFGNYLRSLGDTDAAEEQFALFRTTKAIFAANGVRDSLTLALFAADQGRADEAVAAAEEEWSLRQNVDAADALGWALHSAGRDAEALPYAEQATALGGRTALFLYHRGMIEQALGQDEQARASLDAALQVNPYFSPLHAPQAKEALAALGGPL